MTMTPLMDSILTFFLYAILAAFAQNAVFSRALGVSRLLKLLTESVGKMVGFSALLLAVQLLASPLSWVVVNQVVNIYFAAYRAALRPLVHLLCACMAYAAVFLVVNIIRPSRRMKEVNRMLALATFNTTVLGTLMIGATQGYTLLETMGFATGSSLGYLLAVLLVDEAQRRLRSKAVPNMFKGMPVSLVYIGILALAIYGFIGHGLNV